MDIWLLAAQLMFSGAANPSAEASASWVTGPEAMTLGSGSSTIAPLPSAPKPNLYESLDQGAYHNPGLKNNRTMAVATPATVQQAPSMDAAVNSWPRPNQVMTPNRRSSPPLDSAYLKPVTGSQLYQFRAAALAAGELYAQALPQRYLDQWQRAFMSPTHSDWQGLLTAEAETMARRQGQATLAIMVGDSLALWLPLDELPPNQLWLNQSISGETTSHMLQRLHYFADTRPQTIHIMAGINDLKNGVPEADVLDNLYQMMTRLKHQHPQAQLVVYSILPTRLRELPSDRIQRVNQRLAILSAYQGATFVDLQPTFSDSQGLLRLDLTTDGLHLSPSGYNLWQTALGGS
ncbi:G-D-S-L family lipolytic protein [Nodosilinea sp. LEGE 07298]|uniref:GDSL-type esterase/lipase family protein n=1 Tax=Nodosilinea sp. LEGE 07298 TaxID=2777970 RepID=UPI00187E95B3|nr:GDSL-type esterase/lipase family protein [Nodosilinea sp. LEGE 07298]MBE9111190.1 G-D-S-L family lipolytic protein [Nodosilinea sp. LEGE 07298]